MFNQFQQYIIDNEIRSDFTVDSAKEFLKEIEWYCVDLHSLILDEIHNALDISDLVNDVINNRPLSIVDRVIKAKVVKAVDDILQEIEDIIELEEDDTQEHIDCDNTERARNCRI